MCSTSWWLWRTLGWWNTGGDLIQLIYQDCKHYKKRNESFRRKNGERLASMPGSKDSRRCHKGRCFADDKATASESLALWSQYYSVQRIPIVTDQRFEIVLLLLVAVSQLTNSRQALYTPWGTVESRGIRISRCPFGEAEPMTKPWQLITITDPNTTWVPIFNQISRTDSIDLKFGIYISLNTTVVFLLWKVARRT
jgi:hypothetical protein